MITIILQFNSDRQELTINDTFIKSNNIQCNEVNEVTLSDIAQFLITAWQPQWGQPPIRPSELRFTQGGRALRTGLALGDINLVKTNVFNVSTRPISTIDTNNRRASLIVPTYHNKRTTRTFSNPPASAIAPTDDLNFQANYDGSTTITGADLHHYYTERYVHGNKRASVTGYPNNRNSYYSSRQRYSMHDPSSSSYTFSNQNMPLSYTSDEEEEEEDDMMNHPEFGIHEPIQHVITTGRSHPSRRPSGTSDVGKAVGEIKQPVRRKKERNYEEGGGCCVIM